MHFFLQGAAPAPSDPGEDVLLHASPLLWAAFNGFVLIMLALDLGVFHRKVHTVRVREAILWTVVWVVLALIFAGGIHYWKGADASLPFLAGYLIEKSLSVDNLFVFLVLFSYFKVPAEYQHKVLFWGILGALIMRAALIAVGAVLIARFHWTLYVFGAFLVFTGIKLMFQKGDGVHPEHNPVVRLFRKFVPVATEYSGSRFFIVENGKRLATPLFLVLLTVEFTDLVFALDSIPAIFAVTPDPFIVYTSNVFAILGLRSLYFALAGIMDLFCYLKHGLAVVLGFVGVKMLIADLYKIPIGISLAVVAAILLVSILASVLRRKKECPIVDQTLPAPGIEERRHP
jgi:tellurite resistance protein TerC